MPDDVKPSFAPWQAPPGLTGPLTQAQIAAMRANLQQDPLSVPISQVSGYQRTVAGTIDDDGTILTGSPASTFTVDHTGTGTYTVAFSRAFGKAPAVVVSTNSFGNARFIICGNFATGGFDVEIYNPTALLSDTPWSFFAQGV